MNCSFSSHSPAHECRAEGGYTTVVPLTLCKSDIAFHLQTIKQSQAYSTITTEAQLILLRSALFSTLEDPSFDDLTICPNHRFRLGFGFKSDWHGLCEVNACHNSKLKAERTIGIWKVYGAYKATNKLYMFGSRICDKCKKAFPSNTDLNVVQHEVEDQLTPDPGLLSQSSNKSHGTIGDKDSSQSQYIPDSEEIMTSQNTETDMNFDAQESQRKLLDQFLASFGKDPVKVLHKDWDDTSERTKMDYINKAQEIFICALQVLAPDDYIELKQAVIQSKALLDELEMEEDLDENELLESFGIAYSNAKSWKSRRQILSIIANKFTLSEIEKFIPEISKFRYYIARLHASIFGEGTDVQESTNTGSRIKKETLSDFLEYLVSPEVSVDVLFGDKKMKLSSGLEITVPKIIVTSCKEWIIKEYIEYCKENDISHACPRTYRCGWAIY